MDELVIRCGEDGEVVVDGRHVGDVRIEDGVWTALGVDGRETGHADRIGAVVELALRSGE